MGSCGSRSDVVGCRLNWELRHALGCVLSPQCTRPRGLSVCLSGLGAHQRMVATPSMAPLLPGLRGAGAPAPPSKGRAARGSARRQCGRVSAAVLAPFLAIGAAFPLPVPRTGSSAPSAAGGTSRDGANIISITSWEFQQDPQDVGVHEQWFSSRAKPTLERNISSPGTWQAMGVGKLGGFSGVGWYRRQLVVPQVPAGGSLWLWIGGAPGGVLRSANVYANSIHIGRHVGYVEPLEMDLTAAVAVASNGTAGTGATARQLTLAVAIDSRWNRTEDPLWASGALGNCFADGGCGGMLGNAQLQIRQRAWIEDSVTTSCEEDGASRRGAWRCTVGFAVVGNVQSVDDRMGLTICESTGEGCVSSAPAVVHSGGRATLSLAIPAA